MFRATITSVLSILRKARKFAPFSLIGVFLYMNIEAVISRASIGLSMSLMPISDSSGWSTCASSLANFAQWPDNQKLWCFRRPLYPLILAGALKVVKSEYIFFIFINLLFVLLLTWMAVLFTKSRISLTYLLFGLCILEFAWYQKAANQLMTEQGGIIFSLFGACLSLYGITKKSTNVCSLGIMATVLGQLIRSGNLLLPFVLAMIILSAFKISYRIVAALSFSVFSPSILIKSISFLPGYSEFQNSGNAWATLYGLTTGNRDYTAAYLDFRGQYSDESQLWELAKKGSIESILNDPIQFLTTVVSNFVNYLVTIQNYMFNYFFSSYRAYQITIPLLALIVVIFVIIKSRLHLLQYVALFILLGSEIFFSGLMLKSDPSRTLTTGYATLLFVYPILRTVRKNKITVIKPTLFASARNQFIFYSPFLFLFFLPTNLSSPAVTQSCPENSFLHLSKMQLRTSQIDLGTDTNWWKDAIRQLPNGTFVQGFIFDNNSIYSTQLFFKSETSIPRLACINLGGALSSERLELQEDSRLDPVLQIVGFSELHSWSIPGKKNSNRFTD